MNSTSQKLMMVALLLLHATLRPSQEPGLNQQQSYYSKAIAWVQSLFESKAQAIHRKRTTAAPYRSMEQAIPVLKGLYAAKLGGIIHHSQITKNILAYTREIDALLSNLELKHLTPTDLKENASDVTWDAFFSADGKRILIKNRHGLAQIWDVATGTIIDKHSEGNFPPNGMFNHDRTQIAVPGENNTTRIYNIPLINIDEPIYTLDGRAEAFSPDKTKIVTRNPVNNSRTIWDLKTGQTISILPGNNVNNVNNVNMQNYPNVLQAVQFLQYLKNEHPLFSPDGKKIALIRYGGGSMKMYDVQTGRLLYTKEVGINHYPEFSPDSRKLALQQIDEEGNSGVLDIATGKTLYSFDWIKGKNYKHIFFNPDSTRILAKGDDFADVRNATTGKLLCTLKQQRIQDQSTPIVFSPNGNIIAIMDSILLVTLWNAHSCKEFHSFSAGDLSLHEGSPRKIAFSPDGKQILTLCGGTARLWKSSNEIWNIKHLTDQQMMLLWLISQYHSKLATYNPGKKTELLKLISYFQNIDETYMRSVFDSFTPAQKKDLHQMYDIPLVVKTGAPDFGVEF